MAASQKICLPANNKIASLPPANDSRQPLPPPPSFLGQLPLLSTVTSLSCTYIKGIIVNFLYKNPGHPSLISSFPFPLRLQPPPSPLSSACATTPPPPSPQPLFHAEASSTILLQPPPHPLPAEHSSFLVLEDEFCSKYKMPPGRKVQTNRTAETPTCNSSSLSAGKGNN